MNKKKIILITGVSGVGKDTFAKELEDQLREKGKEALVLHNASTVINFAQKYFNIKDYKTVKGKEIVMELTRLFYLTDSYYFEKILEEKINKFEELLGTRYEYIIIPDWRYNATYDYFNQSKVYDVYGLMLFRENKTDVYKMSEKTKEKEKKLLDELSDKIDIKITLENAIEKLPQIVEDFIICLGQDQ